MPALAVAATAPTRRIVVIDDELAGVKVNQLSQAVLDFLADPTSEDFGIVWKHAESVLGVSPLAKLGKTDVAAEVAKDAFIQKVLLDPALKPAATAGLSKTLTTLWDTAAHLDSLNKAIAEAFPSPEFSITHYPVKPPAGDVLDFDLILLDLVMGSAAPTEDVIQFLTKVSDAGLAADAPLPPIMLFSANWKDLQKNRLRFRTEAKISAAGLSILPKAELLEAGFGSAGLRLLWQKMVKQRVASAAMRKLMIQWNEALKAALQRTTETLWNLDAGALQRIHLTALRDNDPFEEHLHELIAKEHIWHVENAPNVVEAIGRLDTEFQTRVSGTDSNAQLSYRFASHSVEDLESMRELIRHFNWTPVGPLMPLTELDGKSPATLNRFLPLGAVVMRSEEAKPSGVLIHLTQQCDLGKREIFERDTSLIFLRGNLREYVRGEETKVERDVEMILHGFLLGGTDYDLVVDPSQLLGIPATQFQAMVKEEKLKVVGRVRADIAKQQLLAAMSHISRPALFKFTESHGNTIRGKMLLCIPVEKAAPVIHGFGSVALGKPAQILDFSMVDRSGWHLNASASFTIAIWAQNVLAGIQPAPISIDAETTCDALSLGFSGTKGNVTPELPYRVLGVENLDTAYKTVNQAAGSVKEVTLLVVLEGADI